MTKKAKIYYASMDDFWRKEEKLEWLREHPLKSIQFERITPDEKGNWLNLANTDFQELMPLYDKVEMRIFAKMAMGVVTARDEWVYDFDKKNLIEKMKTFVDVYSVNKGKTSELDDSIKWSDTLKSNALAKAYVLFDESKIVRAFYKPFTHKYFYAEKVFNDRLTANHVELFGAKYSLKNCCVGYIGKDTVIPFSVLAFKTINDLNSLSNAAGGNKTFPLYRYDSNGVRYDNITDWALEKFRTHYNEKKISKTDIFHYVYAVLHNPAYRKKYELNLKREFPRLPFYDDFYLWAKWGAELMDLHIGYETVEPYKLRIVNSGLKIEKPKPKLKADKTVGVIVLDDETRLEGVPAIAWEYKLGNRSALEWILDQYKEKKPSDKTIAEKFNTYRFADYKEHVIDLLMRVCNVSVKTMEIIAEMRIRF